MVPSTVVEQVADLVEVAQKSDDALFACLASSAGPLVATTFPDPPTHDVVDVAGVPRIGPFLESEQSLLHHVVAVLDRSGMTLIAPPRHGEVVRETLIGHNPDGAAELIARVAHLTDTSLVLIVGSPSTLDAIHPLVVRDGRLFCPVLRIDIDDERQSDAELAEEMVRHVADRSARRVVEALRLYRYFESHGAGADGVVASVQALRSGRASMLLVHDDPDDERHGWFGADPAHIGYDLADAALATPDIGGEHPHIESGRLVDVVLRSAIGQGVPVMVVPSVPDERLADGMGVIFHVDGFADDGLAELVER
ncbi:MAG: hypothetical protein R2710_05695 [Acidimicrobiales bacterium]